ncbi:MAG TPA: aminoacyl-tRNA hydrolase, partial [Rhabdaerophilum sp.]|nr:aminoacyl-tRNA hydrolase [Rhabdaerophilum sp.]
PPRPRIATKPSKASKERRLKEKTGRSTIKAGRGKVQFD